MYDTSKISRIVNKKPYKNTTYYKVEWKDGRSPSWIRAKYLPDKQLIRQYDKDAVNLDLDEDDSEWEVESVLDKRVVGDRVEYLIKWKHWTDEPTWENSENCECYNLIAAYENPKLKKLWSFSGCNTKLWISRRRMISYMEKFLEKRNLKANLLNFIPDRPDREKQLDLVEGINIGPLRYENHWYLVIILINHICVTRRILVGDALNTLVGVNYREHPVFKRLARCYTLYQIRPIAMTQMDRSDVCAYYTLAAFERALFLMDSSAEFVVEALWFENSRAEYIRSRIKPKTNGQISVTLPIPPEFDPGSCCEFCKKVFASRGSLDTHIMTYHMKRNL